MENKERYHNATSIIAPTNGVQPFTCVLLYQARGKKWGRQRNLLGMTESECSTRCLESPNVNKTPTYNQRPHVLVADLCARCSMCGGGQLRQVYRP